MIPNTSRFLIRLAGSHQHLRKRKRQPQPYQLRTTGRFARYLVANGRQIPPKGCLLVRIGIGLLELESAIRGDLSVSGTYALLSDTAQAQKRTTKVP
jgi:hypothetical protein